MRFSNSTLYPDDEVRDLLRLAFHGVQDSRIYVRVKNGAGGATGAAYRTVPHVSPVSRMTSVDRLVTIRLGPPESFPSDNMVTETRWQEVSEAEYESLSDDERKRLRHWTYSDRPPRYQRHVDIRHPYGGKKSPLIVTMNWREALVAVAAHEARHIHQFRTGKPCSEVDAERFAQKQLHAYLYRKSPPEPT